MMGELWKVSREQCRHATNDERMGIEAVITECQDLIEQFQRNPDRAAYKDITEEGCPEEEEHEEVQAEARAVQFEPQVEEYEPTEYEAPEPEDQNAPEGTEEEPPKRRRSIAEPEQKAHPENQSGGETPAERWTHPAFPEGVPETPPVANVRPPLDALSPELQEAADRLDDVPGPVRWRQEPPGANPYFQESGWYLQPLEEESLEEEEHELDVARRRTLKECHDRKWKRDKWSFEWDKGQLIRHHERRRKAWFDPQVCDEPPVPMEFLKEEKTIKMKFNQNQEPKTLERHIHHHGHETHWWKGETIFYLKNPKEAKSYLAEKKKGQDEADPRLEDEEGREAWRQADLSEWNKVTGSGAVQVLSLEKSREVREELKKEGKEDRILPTKIARRYKPAEQPGEKPVRKSRLCIRGDLDPDALELERFSPTLNTVNFGLLLQIAANENMVATIGDLKNAFCQSRPLCRPNGKLYFQQPKEGVTGLHPEQIVLIIAGCYGLMDAPLHWRKSLTEDLQALGYEISALDPCIMKLYDGSRSRLLGAIAIEVDDLFTVGHEEHHSKMTQLRKKYTFGKYVKLKEEPMGAAFNGRRIRQMDDGEFKIDMQKFIEERLPEMELKKGRRSDRKAPANEEEKAMARATCGALNWLSKEGRPDAAGPSSLLASKLSRLTVEDIIQGNQVVKALKASSELCIRIQPLKKMKMSVITDASFANNGFHSQGGHLVISHESQLRDGVPAKTNVLAWRSGKLQRVVNSTLAAETQSLSKGLGELMWAMVLLKELTDGKFCIQKWRQNMEDDLMVLSSMRTEQTLQQALAVVDAKSLYDHLSKDGAGGADKRTAIEIQIIRQDLRTMDGEVKWVDHKSMLADGLTKVGGSNEALHEVLRTGVFSIRSTEEQMSLRESAKQSGKTNSDLRRIGVKSILGSCETSMAVA